eukprot:73621-Amphidinium_carterae.1
MPSKSAFPCSGSPPSRVEWYIPDVMELTSRGAPAGQHVGRSVDFLSPSFSRHHGAEARLQSCGVSGG